MCMQMLHSLLLGTTNQLQMTLDGFAAQLN
jgi:hypothetical protein